MKSFISAFGESKICLLIITKLKKKQLNINFIVDFKIKDRMRIND